MIRPAEPRSLLNAERRSTELRELRSKGRTQVLVVGAGITGVGVALDAASRGLDVTLVERHDLAHGTSRWSSKLIHGGLRYLASGHIDVAMESAKERHLLMTTIAPHLVRAIPTLIPNYGGKDPLISFAGLIAGDGLRAMAGTKRGTLPRARFVNAATALNMAPALRTDGLKGAIVGWDGQVEDDARLVVAAARTAAAYGARVLTHVDAVAVGEGRATLRDEDGEFTIDCDHIITCTGVWTEELNPEIRLSPSRGTHLIVPAERLGHPTACMTVAIPEEFGRFVFAIPQPDGLCYVGLTDLATDSLQPDPPEPTADELAWLRERISAALAIPLREEDVIGTYSGLRPLVSDAHAQTADISRKHLIARQPSGAIAVTGGKLTTYRKMAEDAVDLISGQPCRTADIALVGAPGDSRSRDRLDRRFGAEAALLHQAVERDHALGEHVADTPALAVEVGWAKDAEGALTPEEAAESRLRITMVDACREPALEAVRALW
ncbi:MAG: glycerol-3-phosphate dehydrogenase/oxidase [Actinobacteria bacterium]|nr:MAG: glycerol-3-phosphate dehydrogenase/oxidase [Actinomycetota bacterium]